MKHYIIDGNNLIGKIKSLNQIQKKNKQHSREKLAFLLGRYFDKRKTSVNLHFDGFENDAIRVSGIKIIYSGSLTADEKIKREIERSKNPKNNILITSDSNLAQFGRVCSCQVIKSEEFAKQIFLSSFAEEEQAKIDAINSADEFKKLFGVNAPDKIVPK
ncbi:MAG TPA: NYN domain-containing protein [Ignavibacteriaceae bacterium]|nr:NYN domain-containing protein [Ignavibacteriaceae bacterium]